ncbi:CtsR family transcriptional regulator [Lentilactobacillus senioris]|uniref:Transcriptional regulator CtsR n=1 Tax=Lentilactobacillus senioris DSM 24302 = JCM 17472 TaxID=1423802 RepID=A0A0R2CNC6_9LACO|nr:CtsR family transcriptional regulator [Lentilactobacillus senioris]KRM93165.1 transcriptional regulator CtsR [Lentilactobacillus senioris DSM 24302 = JCM 17472]
MAGKNISDLIERYLKEILAENNQIEIRRSEIAGLFDVVPSQINYVINTRFTIQNGYIVESKRGGGGYIRIEKANLLDDGEVLDALISGIGNRLSQRDGQTIVKTLYENGLIDRREANIILAVVDKNAYDVDNDLTEVMRANVLVSILNHLRYEK